MRSLVLIVAGTVGAVALAGAPAQAASRHCGAGGRLGGQGPELSAIRASGVSCGTARRVYDRYERGTLPAEWHCRTAASKGFCRRAGAKIWWRAAKQEHCGSV